MPDRRTHELLVDALKELRDLSIDGLWRWNMYGQDADFSDIVYGLDELVDKLEIAVNENAPGADEPIVIAPGQLPLPE